MLKNIFWSLVLLTMATFTMIFGEGFITPDQTPTPTAIVVDTITPIPTEVTIEPSVVPTETSIPTEVATVAPTATFVPTATSTALPPTATVVPTETSTSVPPTATSAATAIVDKFTIQAATPIFMVNFVHTTEACDWQGVAGQIFDASGKPLLNYIVKVVGTYNGIPFNEIGITGMVAGSPYGVGGYEIVLGSSAVASVDLLTIQVFDAQGNPVTNPLPFSTSSSCTQNLVLINFKAK